MKLNIKDFVSFDDFIQYHYDFKYKYLFLSDIYACSYVCYLFIPVINGEINGEPFVVTFEDSFSFKELFYSNEFVVYAIQHLDHYVVKVVDSLNINI